MWLANGTNPAQVQMEGIAVTMTNGYPAPTAAGIAATLADGTVVAAGVTTPGRWQTTIVNANQIEFRLNGAVNPAACFVRYTWNGATATGPAIALPAAANLNNVNNNPCQ